MARETVCRGCGAPIVFVKSKQGKYIPCDAKLVRYRENPDGADTVVVEGEGAAEAMLNGETSSVSPLRGDPPSPSGEGFGEA